MCVDVSLSCTDNLQACHMLVEHGADPEATTQVEGMTGIMQGGEGGEGERGGGRGGREREGRERGEEGREGRGGGELQGSSF